MALKWRDASEISRRIVIESPDYSMLLEDILRPVYESYTAGVYLTNVVARTSEQMAHIELEVNSPSLLPIQNLEVSYRLMREGRKIAYVTFQDQSPFQRQINARAILNNPYSALPIKEARMFKGREKELGQLQEVIGSEQRIAVLYGQLRVGKTSLAHHAVQQVLPEKNHFASYIDLQKLAEKPMMSFGGNWHQPSIRQLLSNGGCEHGGRCLSERFGPERARSFAFLTRS